MEFFTRVISAIASGSGFAALDVKTIIMLFIACVLLYMGIGKGYEPLLMVPIGFGKNCFRREEKGFKLNNQADVRRQELYQGAGTGFVIIK